jgi:1-acyl-sn-glycerol-3-phosphate acyltransferase
VCIVVVYPIAVLMFRVRARNRQRIPARGPVLLVANHVSILDPIACGLMIFRAGRFPHFLAKESVFKGFAGVLLRGAGQIPVKRYTKNAHDALEAAQADLAAGNLVVIYPEGSVTRDPEWWPMQPSTGAARLALTTDAVVVPVAQWGPQQVHDYHRKKLRLRFRARADYLVGEPIDLEAQRSELRAGRPLTAELLRETSEFMMSRVRAQLAELRNEAAPLTFAPRPSAGQPSDSASGSAA